MIRFFAEHPTAVNLLMVIFVVMGLMSLTGLCRETFPDITPSKVEVRILYPGATAEEVEETVCQRVEDAIDGVRFVKRSSLKKSDSAILRSNCLSRKTHPRSSWIVFICC